MRRVVFNQKGGVGKTSVTCNLAAALAHMNQRVLLIDTDSQGDSSHYLGSQQEGPSLADYFQGTLSFKLFQTSLEDCIKETIIPNLYLISADERLSELQSKLESKYKIFKLRDAINQLVEAQGFDEVLIDTPPYVNFYSMSALIAGERVLIPFDCDSFSERAVHQVRDLVDEIRQDHSPDLQLEGVVINNYQASARLPKQAIASLNEHKVPVLAPYLRSSVVMKESHHHQSPLVSYKPKHALTQDFCKLARSLSKKRTH